MTNWRKILGYRTEPREFKIGDRVRMKAKYHSYHHIRVPIGTIGKITYIFDSENIIVCFNWEYPTPAQVHPDGRGDGWCCSKDEIELI
jgi:hypothetical protein